MSGSFDLEKYLAAGVTRIAKDAIKAIFRNPREGAFMGKFGVATSQAAQRRAAQEKAGLTVPAYMIASIAPRPDEGAPLSDDMWLGLFDQARELGVSLIVLIGGEPLRRRALVEGAGARQDILFPMFLSADTVDKAGLDLFDKCRNLMPVVRVDPAAQGPALTGVMDGMKGKGLLFGASVTVTDGLVGAVDRALVDRLSDHGCKALFLSEPLPCSGGEPLTGAARAALDAAVNDLRAARPDMIIVSIPGDERASGQCMAAGQTFMHISASGRAEPCPFAPYSDASARGAAGLKGAMASPLMKTLREGGYLKTAPGGGCVLQEKCAQVEGLLGAGPKT